MIQFTRLSNLATVLMQLLPQIPSYTGFLRKKSVTLSVLDTLCGKVVHDYDDDFRKLNLVLSS